MLHLVVSKKTGRRVALVSVGFWFVLFWLWRGIFPAWLFVWLLGLRRTARAHREERAQSLFVCVTGWWCWFFLFFLLLKDVFESEWITDIYFGIDCNRLSYIQEETA